MNDLYVAASEIQEFLLERGWPFCIIGGLAVLRWGEPQATQDVDISLLTGLGTEEGYVDAILGRFRGRVADARRFALETRVLLITASNGRMIDIGLAGIPYEERMIRRASPYAFSPDISLITCSAEDLIILKAFAGRPKDWGAVEGIITCHAPALDWHYIEDELASLCALKEEPEILSRLVQLRRELESE